MTTGEPPQLYPEGSIEVFSRGCLDVCRAIHAGEFERARVWWAENAARVERGLSSPEPRGLAVINAITAYLFLQWPLGVRVGLGEHIDALIEPDVIPGEALEDRALRVALMCCQAHLCCLIDATTARPRALFERAWRLLEAEPSLGQYDGLGVSLERFHGLCHMRLLMRERGYAVARRRSEGLLEELVRGGAPHLPWGVILNVWLLKGIMEQWAGDYDDSRESLWTAHLLAVERAHWHLAVVTLALCAQLEHLGSRLDAARGLYDRAASLARRHGMAVHEHLPVFVRILWGFFDLEDGRHDTAREVAEQMLEQWAGAASLPKQLARIVLILAYYYEGELSRARAHHNVFCLELVITRGPFVPLGFRLGQLLGKEPRVGDERGEDESLIDQGDNLFVRFANRAMSMIEQRERHRPTLVYCEVGAWFEFPGQQEKVDFSRRHVLRRALLALIAAGEVGLERGELVDKSWPGEFITHEAASTRLRALIYQLRKLGLREYLSTTEVGYRLDPVLECRASAPVTP